MTHSKFTAGTITIPIFQSFHFQNFDKTFLINLVNVTMFSHIFSVQIPFFHQIFDFVFAVKVPCGSRFPHRSIVACLNTMVVQQLDIKSNLENQNQNFEFCQFY